MPLQDFVGTETGTVNLSYRDALDELTNLATKAAAFKLFQTFRTSGSQTVLPRHRVSLIVKFAIGSQELTSPKTTETIEVRVYPPAHAGSTDARSVEAKARKQSEALRQRSGGAGSQSVAVTVTLSAGN
jgi:hypothetical protein